MQIYTEVKQRQNLVICSTAGAAQEYAPPVAFLNDNMGRLLLCSSTAQWR